MSGRAALCFLEKREHSTFLPPPPAEATNAANHWKWTMMPAAAAVVAALWLQRGRPPTGGVGCGGAGEECQRR